jgi:hypothetical protein
VERGAGPDVSVHAHDHRCAELFKLLSLNGLHPVTAGARVSLAKREPTVIDGPFIGTKEVFGGYGGRSAARRTTAM